MVKIRSVRHEHPARGVLTHGPASSQSVSYGQGRDLLFPSLRPALVRNDEYGRGACRADVRKDALDIAWAPDLDRKDDDAQCGRGGLDVFKLACRLRRRRVPE